MGDRSREAQPSPSPGDASAGELPLSVLQEAMWLSWRRDPQAWEHVVPMPFAVEGELDLDRLRFAVGELGRRHPVLRARVVTTAEGRRLSWTAASSVPFTARTVYGRLQAVVAEARTRPFDLRRGPLFRADVLTGREGTAMVLVAHHLVVDGAAGPMLLRDLSRAYAGEPLGAPQDPAPIAAYARRSWELADGAEGERLRGFWRDALSGPAAPVRPVVGRGDGAPGAFTVPIAPGLEKDIRKAARELGVTFFTLIFGALFVTLGHHTGDDLIISTPFHGRRGRVLKGLVGSFANILPFRQRLSDTDTYEALLRRLGSDLRAGIAHADLPLPAILHAAGLSGPQARARTHEVVLTYWDGTQNAAVDLQRVELAHGDSRAVLRLTDATSASDYRLTVLLQEDSTGCGLVWQDTRGDIGAELLATLARDHLVTVADMTAHPTRPIAEARTLLSPTRVDEPGESADGPEYEAGPQAALPETVAALAGIWCEVLNVPAAAAKDSFFELGGHSLMAATLLTRIGERLDVEVSFRDLFTHHVLDELAAVIDQRRAGAPGDRARPPGHPATAADEVFPASRFQEGIWLAERLDPANARYHIPLSWEVAGHLDATVLGQALTALTTRHEILRTRFLDRDGLLSQQIMTPWTPEIDQADLSGMSEDDRELWLRKWSESAVGTLDPPAGRLLRAGLFSVSAEHQVFTLCAHHLVLDGESVPILLRELERCHAAATGGEPLPPPRQQYRDLIAGSGPYSAADIDYWHERLATAPPSLGLTAPKQGGGPHGGVALPLGPRVAPALMPVRLGHQVSTFMVEATAVAAALHRWTGLADLTFGIPMAQRGRAGLEEVIGPKMNTLVLRSRRDDRTTLAGLLGAVREEIIGAFEHQDTPFEEVVRRLRPTRSPGRTPYVDVLVNNVGVAQWSGRLGSARLTPVDFVTAGTEVSKFAMTVTFAERPGTISGTLSYRGDLVDAEDAARVARYIAKVIDRFTEWLDVPVAALCLEPDGAS